MKNAYCAIMWNGRDYRARKMNSHQLHQRVVLHPKKVRLYI